MMNIKKSYDMGFAITSKTRKDYAKAEGLSRNATARHVRGEVVNAATLVAAGRFFGVPVSQFIAWGESEDD